jgi:hypothetical protein
VSESEAEPTGAGFSDAQLVEELRKAKVSLLASLAFGKLAPDLRDLDEARLAIDALKALLPLAPEERRADLQQVLTNLQLAYADAAKDAAKPR